MDISKSDLMRMKERASAALKRAGNIRDKAQEATMSLVRSAEVSASAYTFGYIQGRTGRGVSLLGVPVEVGTGAILGLAGLMGLAGDGSPHLIAVADGAFASYATTAGRGRGKLSRLRKEYAIAVAAAQKAGQPAPPPPPELAAELQRQAGGPLSEQQINAALNQQSGYAAPAPAGT